MDEEHEEPNRGNGSFRPSAAQRLYESGEAIRREMSSLGSAFNDAAQDVERVVHEQMEQRPYAMLAAAAGVGYVLGGGIASRLTRTAVALAGRFALAVAARELSHMLDSAGARTAAGAEATSG